MHKYYHCQELWELPLGSYLTRSLFFLQLSLYILLAGILCIYVNYDCDRQRQEFRRTNGKCLVWGKAPSKVTYMENKLTCAITQVFFTEFYYSFLLRVTLFYILQITASYTTSSGETKTSLLLTSGW